MRKPDGFDPSKYQEYLESPEWKAIARAVKDRDGNRCIVCGRGDDLQVHHLVYTNIYNETDHMDDLITLCADHHHSYHIIQDLVEKCREYNTLEVIDRQQRMREEWEEQERIADEITEWVKKAYKFRDYSKDGDLDMCSYEVIDRAIDQRCKQLEVDASEIKYKVGRKKIHDFFMYRRFEFLRRCMDNGFTVGTIAKNSKFDVKWVSRYYKRDLLEAKLSEEKFINGEEGGEET